MSNKPTPVNFQKKLSTMKVWGKIKPGSITEDETLDLYEVVGIASGVKRGSTDYGDWQALTGNFAAQNCATGERFRSGVCFLPDVAIDPIIGELDTGANAIEFGWVIGVQHDEDVLCGYTYYARPLIEADESDPLELLTKQMTTLPSPEETEKAPPRAKSAKSAK